jgi:hypothetical protein
VKLRIFHLLFLGLALMPACVVMRDPIVLNHSPVTLNSPPPVHQDAEKRDEVEDPVVSQAIDTLGKEVIQGAVDRATPRPIPPAIAASGVSPVRCAEFKAPQAGPVPQISNETFNKIDRNNKDALIKALTDHVAELYKYSREYRDNVQAAQAKHRKTCGR